MNNEAKEVYKKDIELRQMALDFLECLPDCNSFDFPVKISQPVVSGNSVIIHIKIPYSVECFRQYRQVMGAGWKMGSWITTQHEDSVSKHVTYIRPELSPDGKDWKNPIRISIAMHTDLEQSVCHIEQVGVKEVPIWQVVCQ